jgi:hypothetical protein
MEKQQISLELRDSSWSSGANTGAIIAHPVAVEAWMHGLMD